MTIKQVLTDDQNGVVIQPGSLHISATFRIDIPGDGTTPASTKQGDLDFGSFANLIAYIQAEQAKLGLP